MIIAHSSVQTKAYPKDVWYFYQDFKSWPTWDTDVIYVKLDGNFQKGNKGKIKSKGGPEVSFIISELTPNKSFTNVSNLPLTKLIFEHKLEVVNDRTLITHHVEMKGLLSPLFALLIGKKINSTLNESLQNLVKLAESRF